MDGNEKIKVISHQDGIVVMSLKTRAFRREWPRKGAIVTIPFEVLEEAIYDPGFRYMIDDGILSIDNMQAKIDLGLESEPIEGEEPPVEQHPVYSDAELQRLLEKAPLEEFKQTLATMPGNFRMEMAQMAIDLKIRDGRKINLIKEYQNVDVAQGINLASQMEA